MKSWVVGILAGVGGAALGFWAGWKIRKMQELQWEECSEEELQAYAAMFENKQEEQPTETPNVPVIEKEEGTNINPAMDTRKQNYADMWKRDEIIHRENYGDPTPGEEENLGVDEKGFDKEFMEEISNTRIEKISEQEFYNISDKDITRQTIFWYDRDNVLTRLDDNDVEVVIDDPEDFFSGGINVKEEFEDADDTVDEVAGNGLYLFRKDNNTDTLYQLVRYPQSYGKRTEQEEYGGTDDTLQWIHSRNGA